MFHHAIEPLIISNRLTRYPRQQHLYLGLLIYLIVLFQFSVAWKINEEKKNKGDEVLVIDVVIIMKILVLRMVPEKGHEKPDTMIWHRSK